MGRLPPNSINGSCVQNGGTNGLIFNFANHYLIDSITELGLIGHADLARDRDGPITGGIRGRLVVDKWKVMFFIFGNDATELLNK